MTTTAPPILTDNIPDILRQGKRFVAYRLEERGEPKPAKMPYSPEAPKGASSTDPSHWMTFDETVRYAEVAGLDGVMRAFDHSDGLVGFDLDNCRDPETGEIAPWAADIIRRLDTYTEVSPSGKGVKGWAYGTLPAHGRKRGDVEMYGSVQGQIGPCGRFFTQTGHWLDWTPAKVKYRPDAILAIHREVFGEAPEPVSASVDHDGSIPALELGDEDVLWLASESPHNGERFRRLWSGDTSDYADGGNDGASEADGALCELLAFYGGPDPEQIARLFERSGLCRDKWLKRADYRERTIRLALRGQTRFYGDSVRPAPASGSDGAECCACETCPALAEVGRLRRRALDQDDLIKYQQAIIRAERATKDAAMETVRRISDVLAVPSKQLAPASKLVTIATVLEAHSRESRGQAKLPLDALVERTGLSKGIVSNHVQDLAARDGSPIERRVTREYVTNEDGVQQPISVSLVSPTHASVNESLTAVLTMGGPSTKAQKRTAATRERTANWGKCSTHDNDLVAVKGYCPECGEVVGERILQVEDFETLNYGFRNSGPEATPPVVVGTKRTEIRNSDLPTQPPLESEVLNDEKRDSGFQPVLLAVLPSDSPEDHPPSVKVSQMAGIESTDELAARRAQAAQAIPLGRPVDKWKRPTHDRQPASPDRCEVHNHILTDDEVADGGCSWCATASAAAEALPLMAGGGEE